MQNIGAKGMLHATNNHKNSYLVNSICALLFFSGLSLIISYFASLTAYNIFPGFTDHVEPALACISSQFFSGLQLYPVDINTPPFGLQYGPLYYIVTGLFITITENAIMTPKLVSTVAAGAAVITIIYVFIRKSSLYITVIIIGAMSGWLLVLEQWSYWARPDAYLLFTVAVGVLSVNIKRSRIAAILLGIALGTAVSLKIHGFLPFLPLLGLFRSRHGWFDLILALIVSIIITLLPFTLSNISLTGFLKGLETAGSHGFLLTQYLGVLRTASIMIAPLLVVLLLLAGRSYTTLKSEIRNSFAFWAFTPLSLLLVIAIASKKGAGAGHLVPTIPVIAYALLRLTLLIDNSGAKQSLKGVLLAMFYALLLIMAVVNAQQSLWPKYRIASKYQKAIQQDLAQIIEKIPGKKLAIGVGGGRQYYSTWIRPQLIRAGHPYVIEPVAAMDIQASGYKRFPEKALDHEIVDYWLIPAGSLPFSMQNNYGTGPIMPISFQERFTEKWTKAGHSRFFDIWAPKR